MEKTAVWFGFDDLWIKDPDNSIWSILRNDNDSKKTSWCYKKKHQGGKIYFHGISYKLGLSNKAIELQAELLTALLTDILAKEVIFFMPPNQLQAMPDIIAASKLKPKAVISEYALYQTNSTKRYTDNSNTNIYIPDWSKAEQGIHCLAQPEKQSLDNLNKKIPYPVLLPVQAFRLQQESNILTGFKYKESQVQFMNFKTQLDIPRQAKKGQRPFAFGLVWAWGWGEKLWQWALIPQQIEVEGNCQLTIETIDSQFLCQIIQGKKTVFKQSLATPVFQWE